MKRYCMLLDLVDDPVLIREYEEFHTKVWPEVFRGMTEAGVESMQIYRFGNRMAMVMDVLDSFTFERQDQINQSSELGQEWENPMGKYQQAIHGTHSREKRTLPEQSSASTY